MAESDSLEGDSLTGFGGGTDDFDADFAIETIVVNRRPLATDLSRGYRGVSFGQAAEVVGILDATVCRRL